MNAFSTKFSSRGLQRFLPWVAGLILVAGVIAFSLAYFRNTAETLDTPIRPEAPAQGVVKDEGSVPLARPAREAIVLFIQTAVVRRNLAASWPITHPDLKQGISRTEWLAGNIPVVPYPATGVQGTPVKVEYSYADRALLRVALKPKRGSGVKPQVFSIGVKRFRGSWLVDHWVPAGRPPVPTPGN